MHNRIKCFGWPWTFTKIFRETQETLTNEEVFNYMLLLAGHQECQLITSLVDKGYVDIFRNVNKNMLDLILSDLDMPQLKTKDRVTEKTLESLFLKEVYKNGLDV